MFRVPFQRITHLETGMEKEPVTLRENLSSLSPGHKGAQQEEVRPRHVILSFFFFKWNALGIS